MASARKTRKLGTNKRLLSIVSVTVTLLAIASVVIVSSGLNAPSTPVFSVAFVGVEKNAETLLAVIRGQGAIVSQHSRIDSVVLSPRTAVVFDTDWLALNGDRAEFLPWLTTTTSAGKFIAAYGTQTHLLFNYLLQVDPDLYAPGHNPAANNPPLVGVKWISRGGGFGPLIVLVDSTDPMVQAGKISEMVA